MRRRGGDQRAQHFFLPGAGITPAQAEIEQHEGGLVIVGNGRDARFQQRNLGLQVAARFVQHALLRQAAKIQFVDDVEDENLKPHDMHKRAVRHDVQPSVGMRLHVDEAALEAEDGQEIDKIAFDEAQPRQVVEVILREVHRAQVFQLVLESLFQFGQREGRRIAADEVVFGLRPRIAVQQRLPHGEFVQVVFQQAAHDRRGRLRRCLCHARRFFRSLSRTAGLRSLVAFQHCYLVFCPPRVRMRP